MFDQLQGLPMGSLLSNLPLIQLLQRNLPNTIVGQLLPILARQGMFAPGLIGMGMGQLGIGNGGSSTGPDRTAETLPDVAGAVGTGGQTPAQGGSSGGQPNDFLRQILRMYGLGV